MRRLDVNLYPDKVLESYAWSMMRGCKGSS
jgi:hypothetical protein